MRIAMINNATAMQGIQFRIDQLADQLANVETAGYKRKDTTFSDLLNSRLAQPQGFQLAGRRTPSGMSLGHGSRVVLNQMVWSQGLLRETNNPTDLMIDGHGLFELAPGEDGVRRFTRGGAFQLSPVGEGNVRLVTSGGIPVLDVDGNPVDLPGDGSFTIDKRGNVYVTGEGGEAFLTTLRYVHVLNPHFLERIGDNMYRVAQRAGVDQDQIIANVNLNADPQGAIRQGMLELSNVDMGATLTDLINAQRSYQLNARALASADEMNGIVNSIRR